MSLTFGNLVMICLSVVFLGLILMWIRVWEICSHYFLNKFSVPFSLSSPSETPIMHIQFCLMVTHESDRFLHSLFFLLWVISNNISLSFHLLIWVCLFESEVKALYCIISHNVFFSSRIWLFKMISISLLNFLFSSCIVVMILLSLSIFSYSLWVS